MTLDDAKELIPQLEWEIDKLANHLIGKMNGGEIVFFDCDYEDWHIFQKHPDHSKIWWKTMPLQEIQRRVKLGAFE